MMNKLELVKLLNPYLPFGLEVFTSDRKASRLTATYWRVNEFLSLRKMIIVTPILNPIKYLYTDIEGKTPFEKMAVKIIADYYRLTLVDVVVDGEENAVSLTALGVLYDNPLESVPVLFQFCAMPTKCLFRLIVNGLEVDLNQPKAFEMLHEMHVWYGDQDLFRNHFYNKQELRGGKR